MGSFAVCARVEAQIVKYIFFFDVIYYNPLNNKYQKRAPPKKKYLIFMFVSTGKTFNSYFHTCLLNSSALEQL